MVCNLSIQEHGMPPRLSFTVFHFVSHFPIFQNLLLKTDPRTFLLAYPTETTEAGHSNAESESSDQKLT